MNGLTRLFRRPSFEEAFKDAKTPEQICAIARRWIYPVDRGTVIASHWSVVWSRGYGDCDDIAGVIVQACKTTNPPIPCVVINYWPMFDTKATGHALAVGIDWCASNGDYTTEPSEKVAARALDVLRVYWKVMPS